MRGGGVTAERAWTYGELLSAGLELEPDRYAFVYTYPAAGRALDAGKPLSDGDRVVEGWPDLSLYLHVPFCLMNCSFCSLHRTDSASAKSVEEYLAVLEREVSVWGERAQGVPVVAVYFGGGTPTHLTSSRLRSLLDAVAARFEVRCDPEVTIECAPDAGRSEGDWIAYLSGIQKSNLPVTRLSIGVQSWHEDTLRSLGRVGGRRAILECIRAAAVSVDQFNLDFVLGYLRKGNAVDREVDGIVSCLETLASMNIRVSAVSVYQLWDARTVRAARSRAVSLPSAESMAKAKLRLQGEMYAAGFEPSPASTFVREGGVSHRWTLHRCKSFRHLGIGSGAYSFYPHAFAQKRRELDRYSQYFGEPGDFDRDTVVYELSGVEREIRRSILGLKSREFVTLPGLTGGDARQVTAVATMMDHFAEIGILDRRGEEVRLSRGAFLFSNEVAAALRAAADSEG